MAADGLVELVEDRPGGEEVLGQPSAPSYEKNLKAQLAPHCHQKCPPTGRIFPLGCLSRLVETSKKTAKYRMDFGRLPLFIE